MGRDRSYRPTAFWASKARVSQRRDFRAGRRGRNPQMRHRRGLAAVAGWPNKPNGGKRNDSSAAIGALEISAMLFDLRGANNNSRLRDRRALMSSVAGWPNKPSEGICSDFNATVCLVRRVGHQGRLRPVFDGAVAALLGRVPTITRSTRCRAGGGHAAQERGFAHPINKEKAR
jgi:hypothetical protein